MPRVGQDALEAIVQSELHLPRPNSRVVVVLRLDPAESSRIHVLIGQIEVRVIEEIVKLCVKLESMSFLYNGLFDQSKVIGLVSWTL